MLIHNESYDDKIMRLRYEMLLMRSKTGQVFGLDKAEDFDSALDEASRPETLRVDNTPSTETLRVDESPRTEPQRRQISSLSETTQIYWPNDFFTGRDTLITEVAQKYAQAMDVSGQHDTVFVAPA